MNLVPVLRRAYRDSGLTFAQIADLAGVHENTVINVMGGKETRWKTLRAICDVLDINLRADYTSPCETLDPHNELG